MILLINCGSSKSLLIAEIVERFYSMEIIGLNDFSEEQLAKADGVIISGAPILLSEIDPAPFLKKMDWIKNYTKPLLGICFGHQIIGMTFGATILRQREDRDWQEVEVITHSPIFNNLEVILQMMEDHCESVSVPPNFILSATSDVCVNESMFHKKKPIFGVQFHPEVSGENGILLLENFVKLVQSYNKSSHQNN